MLVFILLVASFDLLLGYTGIVSFAHTMFFGIGAYGVAIASTRLGPGYGSVLLGTVLALGGVAAAVAGDRVVFAAREGDLLRHDHAGGGYRFSNVGVAAVRLHRRRRRADLQEPRVAEPVVRAVRQPRFSASASTARSSPTTCCSWPCWCCCSWRCCGSSIRPSAACCRPFARTTFRAEAIGFRTVVYRTWSNVLSALFATAGRCAAGAVAALRRARHHAVVRDHARHSADRGHRRHGHDVRRGGGGGAVRAGAELPARPVEDRCHGAGGRAGAVATGVARPLAAVAGRAVRAVGLPLPHWRGRPPARCCAASACQGRLERRSDAQVALPAVRRP